MELLLQNLTKLTRLTQSELVPLLDYFLPLTARSNTTLLSPGVVASKVWFIGSGILRSFYFIEEKKRKLGEDEPMREVTNWIVPAGGFLTDVRSFLNQTTCTYYIEALEASRLYSLSFDNYLTIQRTQPEFSRAIFENTLIMADLRVQMCNLRYSEDRRAMFENRYPGMTARLSVNIQASYLNIDPTTLSRLRSKRSKK